MMVNLKEEISGLSKTLGAIAASFGVIWMVLEPMVEDYINEQIEVSHKPLIERIESIEKVSDEDYNLGIQQRNKIVQEIQRIHYGTGLKVE